MSGWIVRGWYGLVQLVGGDERMEEGVICLAGLGRRCELVVVLPSLTAEGKLGLG